MTEAILATVILGWLVAAGALVHAKPRVLERQFAMGERTPWYLGVAWVNPLNGQRILWPIGLNVLAGWGVDAYHWTRAKAERGWLHRLLRDVRTESWSRGYSEGLQEGKRQVEREYARRLQASGYKGPERRASVLQFRAPRPFQEG
jgi:hypothetical protein